MIMSNDAIILLITRYFSNMEKKVALDHRDIDATECTFVGGRKQNF